MNIKDNPLANKPAPTEFVNQPSSMPKSITFLYESFKSGTIIFAQMMAVFLSIVIPALTIVGFVEGEFLWASLGLLICIVGVGALHNMK